MKDELRDNLIALLVKRGHKGKDIVDEVKEILSLIDAERCVWTKKYMFHGEEMYLTSCNKTDCFINYTFCPHCGKRIEVKDGQG